MFVYWIFRVKDQKHMNNNFERSADAFLNWLLTFLKGFVSPTLSQSQAFSHPLLLVFGQPSEMIEKKKQVRNRKKINFKTQKKKLFVKRNNTVKSYKGCKNNKIWSLIRCLFNVTADIKPT